MQMFSGHKHFIDENVKENVSWSSNISERGLRGRKLSYLKLGPTLSLPKLAVIIYTIR